MSIIFTVFVFIFVLGLLVLVHEFGHFIMAKRSGVQVDEFGFGFPPRIVGKQFGKTLYTLNWIPLGGFVKIKGVAGDDEEATEHALSDDSFARKPYWRKFLILFAGIGMNFLLAIVLFTIVLSIGTTTAADQVQTGGIVSDKHIFITAVLPDSPAASVGIEPGAIITKIGDTAVFETAEVQEIFASSLETPLDVTVEQNDAVQQLTITPTTIQYENETYSGIGLGLQSIATVRYPVYRSIIIGIQMTAGLTIEIFRSLGTMVMGIFSDASVTDNLSGPVGIAQLTGEVARVGVIELLNFMALLSVNLAIFNLLPLPALDGGRIIFLFAEMVRRKPVNKRFEALVHNIGFLLLLLLVLLVTIQDIARL